MPTKNTQEKSHKERIIAVLTASAGMMSASQIAEAIGLRAKSAAQVRNILNEMPEGRVQKQMRTTKAGMGALRPCMYYGMKLAEPKIDLWRGWFNPKTGITAARLGPDGLEDME